jgi:hypothetical protein
LVVPHHFVRSAKAKGSRILPCQVYSQSRAQGTREPRLGLDVTRKPLDDKKDELGSPVYEEAINPWWRGDASAIIDREWGFAEIAKQLGSVGVGGGLATSPGH